MLGQLQTEKVKNIDLIHTTDLSNKECLSQLSNNLGIEDMGGSVNSESVEEEREQISVS